MSNPLSAVAHPGAQPRAAGLLWLLGLGAIVASIVLPWIAPSQGVGPMFPFLIAIALIHGYLRYGWRNLLLFVLVCLFVSNVYENASILYGFPFGHYHYTFEPKLFNVPVTIGLIYFGIAYCSWQVAAILLDEADANLSRRGNLLALPLVAAVVMTMFDVSTDATASTLLHAWIWHGGGGFYGVPVSNFLGWTLTTWTFFQIFAWFIGRRLEAVRPLHGPGAFAVPVLAYASLGLHTVASYWLQPLNNNTTAVDKTGYAWKVADIYEGGAVCATYTVVFMAGLALFKLWRAEPGRAAS